MHTIIIIIIVIKVSVSCPLMDATGYFHPDVLRETVPTKRKQQPARLLGVITCSATV